MKKNTVRKLIPYLETKSGVVYANERRSGRKISECVNYISTHTQAEEFVFLHILHQLEY